MLTISKITNASTQVTYNNFGSVENFNFDIEATYTFDLYDVTLQDGDVLLDGVQALKQAYLRRDLVARIGTDLFENGKVTSIDIPQNHATGNVECSLTIKQAKVVLAPNETFSDNLPLSRDIESFSENFNFTRSADNYSYTRTVSLKYKSDDASNFLRNANIFVKKQFLNVRPSFGYQVDGISEVGRFDNQFKPLVSEQYDLVNNSVTFTERFSSGLIKDTYSEQKSYSLSAGEDGFQKKNYSITIRGLKEPLEINIHNAVKTVIAEVISANTSFGNPISIEKNVSKDSNNATLSINFDSNPAKNRTDSLTYSVSRDKRENYYDYAAKMEFNSDGASEDEKFTNTKTFWIANKNIGITKVGKLFPSAGALYEKSRSTSFDKFEGKITETVTYTDDPAYGTFEDGVLKSFIDLNINGKVDRIHRFLHLDNKIELYSQNDLRTIAKATIKSTVVCRKSKGLTYGLTTLNSRNLGLPESDVGIESDTATIDINNGITTRTVNYSFF